MDLFLTKARAFTTLAKPIVSLAVLRMWVCLSDCSIEFVQRQSISLGAFIIP